MFKLKAEAFYKADAALKYAEAATHSFPADDKMDEDVIKVTNKHVKELESSLLVIGTQVTLMAVEKLIKQLDNGNISFKDFRDFMYDIDSRLSDELSLKNIYVLDDKKSKLLDSTTSLYGKEVEVKFPKMAEDIAEAGKCLALSRPTAAVFHLMRVMELAVQHLGNDLSIKLVHEKKWQNILDEINKAIKSLDAKLPRTKALAEVASHLYTVKVAWRNEVMHPKQTYTADEAEAIFANVRTFIRDLAISI